MIRRSWQSQDGFCRELQVPIKSCAPYARPLHRAEVAPESSLIEPLRTGLCFRILDLSGTVQTWPSDAPYSRHGPALMSGSAAEPSSRAEKNTMRFSRSSPGDLESSIRPLQLWNTL